MSDIEIIELDVTNIVGARATTLVVQLLSQFDCDVFATPIDPLSINTGYVSLKWPVNAKSIMSLLYARAFSSRLKFEATGKQAKEALDALEASLEGKNGY